MMLQYQFHNLNVDNIDKIQSKINAIEMDFNKIGGVQFCETSLLTQTMVLKYNSRKIALTEIENVFRKWECNPREYYYQKLY